MGLLLSVPISVTDSRKQVICEKICSSFSISFCRLKRDISNCLIYFFALLHKNLISESLNVSNVITKAMTVFNVTQICAKSLRTICLFLTAGKAQKTNKQWTPEWKISDTCLWDIISTTTEEIWLKDLYWEWFENKTDITFLKQNGIL